MKYVIAEILKTAPANYGKTRVSFKVENDDRRLSGFFPVAPSTGTEVDGEIVQNGEWWNFELAKTGVNRSTGAAIAPTPDMNRVEVKIDALRADIATLGATITGMKSVLGEILQTVKPIENEPF